MEKTLDTPIGEALHCTARKPCDEQEAILTTTRSSIQYPKIRPVEAFPIEHNGQKLICLRDPSHIAEHAVFVHPAVLNLLSLFDGNRSLADIQVAFTRASGGVLLPREQLHALIEQLDANLLLDSERFVRTRERIEEEFRRSNVRESVHAGTAYEADPERLRAQLDGFFTAPGGPGTRLVLHAGMPVKGLIAPHIDFHRGGPCYAWAYREMAASLDADLYIILGIGHSGPRSLFTLTAKDFITPFGTAQTDREFVARIQEACPFDLFADEFLHKHEHSIEFQVVFLQYLLRDRPPPMIVPVLCGSFQKMVEAGQSPSDHPQFQRFVQALKQAIAASGKQVCLIAGVDLAHVGMRFGDRERLTPDFLDRVRNADLRLLRHVERLDADAFFQDICDDQDRRRICGYPAIYTLLTVVEAQEAQLIKYDQAVDTATQQAVTFAGMVLR